MLVKLYCDLVVCIGYWRGCPVAVKLLYDHLAAVQRNIQLVQQEASVAWKIHHPNIASVCGVTLELEEKKAWIIMELHSGSMSGVIDACQRDVAPLTLREKVDMTHDSLCGLEYPYRKFLCDSHATRIRFVCDEGRLANA